MDGVSVIIPVRNGQAYVAEAVGSVIAQGQAIDDVIVVNDQSSDRTVDIVCALTDRRLTLIHTEQAGSGVSLARNLGLRHARSRWIMFLDADDRLRPGAVDALLHGAEASDVAVYGDYDRIDEKGVSIGHRNWLRSARNKPSGRILERLLAGNFIVNGGIMLIRREALLGIGGFHESLRYCEDWHAWCRLATRGQIAYRPKTHVLDYRVHRDSTMMARRHTLDDYRPALDAIYSDPDVQKIVPAARLPLLKYRATAHLQNYLLSQAVRSRRFGEMFSGFADVLRRDPLRLPRTIAVCGAAYAGL